jgi:hypothetical protein
MIDARRSQPLIDPVVWATRSIGIIGAGAVGSKIALELACLGLTNVTVYDFDKVEAHNLSNQAFCASHIGKPKVLALRELIIAKTGQTPNWRFVNGKFSSLERHRHVVMFSAVDTVAGRKEVMLSGAAHGTLVVYDSRMDAMQGSVCQYQPTSFMSATWYEGGLPSEDYEGEVSACGLPINCGATSSHVASIAVTRFINDFTGDFDTSQEALFASLGFDTNFNLRSHETWTTN